jgi:transcriptional regulator GlxA family with amidase domain
MPSVTPTQIIYFLILPELLMVDLAGPADAFLFANRRSDQHLFELRYISPVQNPTTSLGLTLHAIAPLPETVEDEAWIILPGTLCHRFDANTASAKAAIAWLKKTRHQQRIICICAGALIAAHAGLLSHKHATTHHSHLDEMREIDPSIAVEDNRIFVEDGNIATSAGVTAGIDLSLHLISQHCSPPLAMEVARSMLIYFRRSGQDAQLSPWLMHRNHVHRTVHKAQDLLSHHPAYPWQLDELADKLGTSTRHLTRLFKEHTEVSVHDYLNSLRLNLADQFLSQTNWSIERIAEAAGFGSARQFRRVWQAKHDSPPSQFQRK